MRTGEPRRLTAQALTRLPLARRAGRMPERRDSPCCVWGQVETKRRLPQRPTERKSPRGGSSGRTPVLRPEVAGLNKLFLPNSVSLYVVSNCKLGRQTVKICQILPKCLRGKFGNRESADICRNVFCCSAGNPWSGIGKKRIASPSLSCQFWHITWTNWSVI